MFVTFMELFAELHNRAAEHFHYPGSLQLRIVTNMETYPSFGPLLLVSIQYACQLEDTIDDQKEAI